MPHEELQSLAQSKRWDDLETAWLSVITQPDAAPAALLGVIDAAVKAGKGELAGTMGWAWLSSMKEMHSPREALRLGRGLLLRLPDGEQLRDEILSLYKQTHDDRPDLDAWVDRSGLKAGKSVRRALRFLDVGLRLKEDGYLIHRTDDVAVQVVEIDMDAEELTLKDARRTRTMSFEAVIEDYDIADENDLLVLQQLNPQRIEELIKEDPIKLAIGILRCHKDRIDRDELKLLMVPRYVAKDKWSDWWGRIRTGVKRSPNVRIEGRSPMYLIYDPAGMSLEEQTWPTFAAATTPRQWLEVLDGYLRDAKHRKAEPDKAFVQRVETALLKHVDRFCKHREPREAFAAALIIDLMAAKGLPFSEEAQGTAGEILRSLDDPAAIAGSVGDTRLWSGITACIERTFPEEWPKIFAEMILRAPPGQCDTLARHVEKAGRGELLPAIIEQAIAAPGRHTDAMMWVWKGPGVKVDLPIPPMLEMFNSIMTLVGPARLSEGKAAGQSVIEMRARVRTGLGAKDYASFRACIKSVDLALARTIRLQVERAEGLGPSVQSEMQNILTKVFPGLYVKEVVSVWDDETVLYFSRPGLRRMEADRDELVNVKMRDNAKAIGEAAAHGDLSENSEYKFALEERDLLRARLAQMNRELTLAKILKPTDVPTDHVSIGQRLTLEPATGGEPMVLAIVGIGDSDIQRHAYAYQTPLAGRLLGKHLGDTVSLALDGENELKYRIARIEEAVDGPSGVPASPSTAPAEGPSA